MKRNITYPLAHGGAGALEVLAAVFVANGRWRMKGFAVSLEAFAENNCLLFSCTFKFFINI